MLKTEYLKSKDFFLSLLIFFLLTIWSIAGTIALRHGLILAILALCANSIRTLRPRQITYIAWPILLITAFFLIHNALIAVEPQWSWNEFSSQWLKAIIIFFTGLVVANQFKQTRKKNAGRHLLSIVVYSSLLYALLVIATVIYKYTQTGQIILGFFEFQGTPGGGKLEISFVLGIGLAAVAADLIGRLTQASPITYLSRLAIFISALIILTATILAGARNGLIGIIFLIISTAIIFIQNQGSSTKRLIAGSSILVLISSFVFLAVKSDPRWNDFVKTAEIAWQIDKNQAWLTHENYPKLDDTRTVESSAFIRISFIKAGLLAAENQYPLGYGYGREVFKHVLLKIYGIPAGGHSHSGYIDLLLMGGFAGIAIWLSFAFFCIFKAFVNFEKNKLSIFLFFIVSGFNGRMILDSVFRDHYLQIHFFLVAATLFFICDSENKATNQAKQKNQ